MLNENNFWPGRTWIQWEMIHIKHPHSQFLLPHSLLKGSLTLEDFSSALSDWFKTCPDPLFIQVIVQWVNTTLLLLLTQPGPPDLDCKYQTCLIFHVELPPTPPDQWESRVRELLTKWSTSPAHSHERKEWKDEQLSFSSLRFSLSLPHFSHVFSHFFSL